MSFRNSNSKYTKRSLSLDAVRGVAILIVVVFHFREFGIFPALPSPYTVVPMFGMFGVDLFYVLSGFFITKAIISPAIWNPGSFLLARVTRIYPAFLFSLAFFVGLKIFNEKTFDLYLLTNIMLHSLMLHNLIPGIGGSINGTYWTLGVEFPYYFFMLAISYFLRTWKSFWITSVVMLVLCLVWRAGVFLFIPTDMGRFFASTQLPGTLDAFAFGGMAAGLVRHEKLNQLLSLWRWPVLVIGLVVTALSLNYVAHHAGHYWALGWTAILWRSSLAAGFAIIIAACANMQYSKMLHYSGLPWLGKISFSLYIYHLFPAILARKYLPEVEWQWKLPLASLLALGISWASWRFIETRFHRTTAPIQ